MYILLACVFGQIQGAEAWRGAFSRDGSPRFACACVYVRVGVCSFRLQLTEPARLHTCSGVLEDVADALRGLARQSGSWESRFCHKWAQNVCTKSAVFLGVCVSL